MLVIIFNATVYVTHCSFHLSFVLHYNYTPLTAAAVMKTQYSCVDVGVSSATAYVCGNTINLCFVSFANKMTIIIQYFAHTLHG